MSKEGTDTAVSILTDADKRELNLAVLTETTAVMNPVEYSQMKKMAAEVWSSGALNDSFSNVQQQAQQLAS